jgi:hypothetical protein
MSEDAPVNTGAAGWSDEGTSYFAVRRMQTKLHGWAGADASRRFDDLFNLVYDRAFLMHAWQRVSTNAGKRTAGIDRATVTWIETHVGVVVFLDGIREALKSGEYRPVEVRQVMIPKVGSSGKLRKLGIPTVADRVVQTALKAVLEPIFEVDFLPCSYGFRPNRSTHDAVAEIHHLASEPSNYHWVLEADIKACLDAWSHCSCRCLMGQNRPSWAWDTLMRKPFRRPVRRWTAGSSPRLTRCNTVCRETPRALVASCIASQPSGASSTNRVRSSSVSRIRQGAPGVSCSAGMKPSLIHRCRVDGAVPRVLAASATVSRSPSAVPVGGS